jgi:hypothetical protein
MIHEDSMPFAAAAVAIAAGLFGGYALVGGSPGVGVPLTALVVGATVVVAQPTVVRSSNALIFGGLSFSLLTMAALRDAEWVVALDILGALGLACVAVSGVTTWSSVMAAGVGSAINSIVAPGRVSLVLWRTLGPSRRDSVGPLLRGSLVGAALLLVFGSLLMSADSAFAQITENLIFQDWGDLLLPARAFAAFSVIGIAGGLTVTLLRAPAAFPGGHTEDDPFAPTRRLLRERLRARSEWVVPLALLDLLFGLFVAVQIAVLFGGRDHVLENAGVTYAQYARSGFFQLLAVAFLTLIVIALAVRVSKPDEPRDKFLLRILLGILCLCTLVILVSALQRLKLYEETYGFTRLRIAVHATILWLGGIFAMVIAAGAGWRARWLPRASLVFTGAGLLAFSLANPDAIIAHQNVERYASTGKLDGHYLSTLSADAVPTLMQLPDEELDCILPAYVYRLSFDEPWTSANLSRARTADLLDGYESADRALPISCSANDA